MGPPKILENDPDWRPHDDTPIHGGTTSQGMEILDKGATPSWYPYYYRAVAIGKEDLANGDYSGESTPSSSESEYSIQPNPPLIGSPALSTEPSPATALFVATLDLPVNPSPLGPSLIELLKYVPDPARPGKLRADSILSSAPNAIAVGTLALPPPTPPVPPILITAAPPAANIPIFPPPPPPPLSPDWRRSVPGADGHWTLQILVPFTTANQYTLQLTDPLGRQSAKSF